jgi:hypothetical protein
MISRTLIPNKDEWVTIEAVHKVGDDWKYNNTLLPPVRCEDFHLRFRIPDSSASFFIDNVQLSKISSGSSDDYGTGLSGFFANPNFEYSYQNWMYSSNAATLRKDPDLNREVMVFKPGNILSQNILKNVIPGKSYRFRFMTKITNVDSVDMVISIRVKFNNRDLTINGPCNKAICNFYMHPLRRNIRGGGGWQEVVTDQVTISNWTQWNGTIDFVSFQMTDKGMNSIGEYSVAGFEELADDYTFAPSVSFAPSSSPTNLVEDNVAYIVKYAGEVRTVINYPFQIDSTGEVLASDGIAEYQLCDVDEVEGRKSDVSEDITIDTFFFFSPQRQLTAFPVLRLVL